MKLYRNAIILLIVLMLLGGVYFVVSKQKGKTPAENPLMVDNSVKILSEDFAKVNQIHIKNNTKNYEMVLAKDKDKWSIKSPEGVKASDSGLSDVAASLTNTFTADKVIEEKAANLEQYGLQNPVAVMDLTYTDNKTQTLALGGLTLTADGYYVLDVSTNKVYSVSKYTGDQLLNAKKLMMEKALFPSDLDHSKAITLEKGGKLVFAAKKISNTEWNLTAPIETSADLDAIGNMFTSLNKVSADSYVDENPTDLSKYGLTNPAYTVETDSDAGTQKILLGSKTEDGKLNYAKMADKNEVFTVNFTAFDFIDKSLKEVVNGFAYLANINDVSEVTVEMDGMTNHLSIQSDANDKSKEKFLFNGKEAAMKDAAGNQPFRTYYQELIGLAVDEMDLNATPTGKAEITITYTLKKAPGTMKVEFIPKDSGSYYIMRNGKYTYMVMNKARLDAEDGLRAAYKHLIETMNQKK